MNNFAIQVAAEPVGLPLPRTGIVRVDKIASSTVNLHLSSDLEMTSSCVAAPGNAIVVRTVGDSHSYNTLELVSGRMARVNPGDVIAGVLGERRALKAFTGEVPENIEPGDRLHLLNLGGVIGRCVGHHARLGKPIEVEVLGMPIKDGRILNISDHAIPPLHDLQNSPPLVIVAGACMSGGKTHAACEIIKQLTRIGLRAAAGKLTGVACLRDTLNMQDHGAIKTLSFLDCGLASTVGQTNLAPMAKGIIAELSKAKPDCVVLEMGDGLLGGYGVEPVFRDKHLMAATAAFVFCASDFVGAWGGRELLARLGVNIDVVSGPVTDSQMGTEFIEKELGLSAANAIVDGDKLARLIRTRLDRFARLRSRVQDERSGAPRIPVCAEFTKGSANILDQQ